MRFLFTISYVGTGYHGWQVQANAVTVCEVMQDALERVLGERPGLVGCSRTDAGVHARNFCFHLDADSTIPCDRLIPAVNAQLPSDVSVLDCRYVPSEFHARYSAKGKEYIYRVYDQKTRNPFLEPFACRIKYSLNAEKMDTLAKGFIGTHDFKAFRAANGAGKDGDTIRDIYSFNVKRVGETIDFTVSGSGFLYNGVRIMVGTLIDMEAGRINESLAEIIRSGQRSRAGKTMPPHGLYLNRVFYEDMEGLY